MRAGEGVIRTFAEQVDRIEDAIELAKLVCSETRRTFDILQCAVGLFATSGRPVITVDNLTAATDEQRLIYLSDGWKCDPLHRAICLRQRPIDDQPSHHTQIHTLVLPLIEPAGLLGIVRCGHPVPFSRELERDLVAISTLASVRLVQCGITAFADSPELAQLTPRQHEIARLVSRGYSNPEIANLLDLSTAGVAVTLHRTRTRLQQEIRRYMGEAL